MNINQFHWININQLNEKKSSTWNVWKYNMMIQ